MVGCKWTMAWRPAGCGKAWCGRQRHGTKKSRICTKEQLRLSGVGKRRGATRLEAVRRGGCAHLRGRQSREYVLQSLLEGARRRTQLQELPASLDRSPDGRAALCRTRAIRPSQSGPLCGLRNSVCGAPPSSKVQTTRTGVGVVLVGGSLDGGRWPVAGGSSHAEAGGSRPASEGAQCCCVLCV